MNRYLLLLLLATISFNTFSKEQKKRKIIIIRANDLISSKGLFGGAKRLIENVRLKYEDVILDCDSAHLFSGNTAKIYGNVHVNKSDSVNIYADYAELVGSERLLKLRDNAICIGKDATLYSDYIDYYMNEDIASYKGGGKIISGTDTIISDIANFYSKLDSVEFIDSVKIYGVDYKAFSNYVNYNVKTKFINFNTPTEIFYEDSYLYSELGQFDSEKKESFLYKNNYLQNKSSSINADTIFANEIDSVAEAFSNVVIIDTTKKIILQSDYAFVDNKRQVSLLTKNVLCINYNDIKDSLFLTSDTIRTQFDSTGVHNNLYAYHNVKIFKTNMQGICDSIHYSFEDSVIYMFNRPIMWIEENQALANTIIIHQKQEKIDSVELISKAYIFTKKTETDYNQIKGNNIYVKLLDNKIKYTKVVTNAESIYYLEKKNGDVVGLNRTSSDNMKVDFRDGKIYKINFKINAKGEINPLKLILEEKARFKDFQWYINLRPIDKNFTTKKQ